jgi:hypothetical protein
MLMSRLTLLLAALTLATVCALPSAALACPNCRDAIPASSGGPDDDGFDPMQESKAWNESIYLFVSMPYLLLGVFGLCVYRAMRQAPGTNPMPAGPAVQETSNELSVEPQAVRPNHSDRGSDGRPG